MVMNGDMQLADILMNIKHLNIYLIDFLLDSTELKPLNHCI